MKKVRWNSHEIELIAEGVAEMQAKYPVGMAAALEQVQRKVLPRERWHQSHAAVGAQLQAAIERHRSRLADTPAAPPPAPAPPSLEEAVGTILAAFVRVSDRLDEVLRRLPPVPNSNQATQWPETPRLPRVAIAGLLPDQVKFVERACKNVTVEPWNRTTGTTAHPDFVVLITGFSDHALENELKAAGVPIVKAGRGVNSAIWAVTRGLGGRFDVKASW